MNGEEGMRREEGIGEDELARIRRILWGVGGVGLALSAAGAFTSPVQFFHSYLLAYLFWVSIALGCLPILMLHHQTGGAWGLVLRRLLEAGARTLPLMALFFLPLLFGLSELYLWARPEAVAASEALQHKRPYLNVPFFVIRAVVYFAAWVGISTLLNRWSLEQDRTADVALARRMQILSGPGLAVYGLTVTFAAVDWLMSLDPLWFSSIFGALWAIGQLLGAFAFAIAVLVLLADREPFVRVVNADVLHDLGKLLLAFVMVWAYFAFSQYLIIWAGNLPEEIGWVIERSRGGWEWVAVALVFFHFALPFVLLLSRDLKRHGRRLAWVAIAVVVMRFVEHFWFIAPAIHHEGASVHWLDLAAPIGIGAIWLAAYLGQLAARPLLPLHDPYFAEAFPEGHEHE